MKKNYDFIAVITARAGSKSVKNKNIKKINNYPLLAYTIEAAKRSKYIKEIYVSTDGNKIAKVAKKYGAKVIKRPKSLSGGVVMPDLAVTHVIKSLENKDEFNFKNVVFFQPTSALRRHGDVDKAIEIFKKEKLDSLFSSADMHVTIWRKFGKKVKAISYNYKKRTRRQDSPKQYVENGSFYITKKEIYKKTNNRLGGKISTFVSDSWSIFEIDTMQDYQNVSLILKSKLAKKAQIIIPSRP